MTAGLLAAVAAWCLVPGPPSRRATALFGAQQEARHVEPRVVVSVLAPVAATVVLGLLWGPVVGLALGPVGRAFRRAGVSGMPVAQVVSGVADELRRERRARLREQSRKVAVRTAAPLGACFLPAFFLVGVVPTVLATFRTLGW